MGRVQGFHESRDGKIRSADVFLPNKNIITRPVNKLYPLEVSCMNWISAEESSIKP